MTPSLTCQYLPLKKTYVHTATSSEEREGKEGLQTNQDKWTDEDQEEKKKNEGKTLQKQQPLPPPKEIPSIFSHVLQQNIFHTVTKHKSREDYYRF